MDVVREDATKNRRRRKIVLVAIGAVLLAAVSVVLARLETAAPTVERERLWFGTVERGEFLREVRGPGTLVPKDERWIAATSNALVERILVKPGAEVQPDTVILEMSNPELSQALLEAQLELEAAEADHQVLGVTLMNQRLDREAQLAEIEAEYLGAALQVKAEAELFEKRIISELDHERSKLAERQLATRFDIERRRLKQTEAAVKAELAAGESRLQRLRNIVALRDRQASDLMVRAGIAGVLQEVAVEAGQQVASGATLARVAKTGSLMAELRIPEIQAKDLLLGQPAVVDTRNGTVKGEVSRIDPAVQNGSVVVDIDFVEPLPAGARPDLSVNGTIEIDRLDDVLYMGRPVYAQAAGYASLFRLEDGEASAVRVQVRLGRGSVNAIEVLDGLAPGDRIILSDMSQWDTFDRIKLEN